MRFRVAAVLLFALLFSCKVKDSTPEGLKDDLKKTMQAYLYSSKVNNDSSNIRYRVLDVVYFDDTIKNRYVCVFSVNLKQGFANKNGNQRPRLDTTGQMEAYISKDFKTVERLY